MSSTPSTAHVCSHSIYETGKDCTNVAVWKKHDAGRLTGWLCDTCYLDNHPRYQMEYKWIGASEDDPKHIFTCQPGGGFNVFRHADPCTCGSELKSIIDDLELGYQATQRFRSFICKERGSWMCNNLNWEDIDGLANKICRLQDLILTNRSTVLGGCKLGKRKRTETETA